MSASQTSASETLKPFLPRLVIEWLRTAPDQRVLEVDGTLAFADISGFTRMSERLARNGKAGAEELADVLDDTFTRLLAIAYADGAGLVKWGGDAVLLLFDGVDHAARACRASVGMQRELRRLGPIRTSAGRVALRMSIGVHSGRIPFALVGDVHRELLVCGPAVTRTVALESAAEAGQVLMSDETAALVPAVVHGERTDVGVLLRAAPEAPRRPAPDVGDVSDLDLVEYVPLALRERLLSGSREAEHRAVTVAFVEFAGTDALLVRDGLAALGDALDALVRCVQAAAVRHDVSFHETDIAPDGGRILLVAGAPTTTGADEDRVLLAALAAARPDVPLQVRVGVNRGHVFSGTLGPYYRRTFSIKGDAVNLAARVMGRAAAGQVVATAAVLDHARAAFEHEPLAPFMVKGKSHPVSASVVGAPDRRHAADHRDGGPLVGRETEVAALADAIAGARDGRGRLVEIVGEPGIGKSRLVAEARTLAAGFARFHVACEAYESSTPYFAIRALLRATLGLGEEDEEAALAGLVASVRSAAPELEPWLPLIATAAGLDAPATRQTRDLGWQARRTQLGRAVADLLFRVVDGPVLLTIEDLHWMDEASGTVLRELVARLSTVPWVVVATRRRVEEGVDPVGWPGLVRLVPEPLGDDAAAALIDAATAEAPFAPHEIDELRRRAGGNPLFLRELVAAARAGSSVEGLPDSVEAVIAAQIDRLPAARRALLRRFAVIGQAFAEDLALGILDHPPPDPWAGLDEFVQPDAPGQRRFVHALIRDAAYEGLSFRERRALHGRVGDAIQNASDVAELEHAELLSLHFYNAQRYEDAWRYSRAAGERAQAKWANVEASDFFARALDCTRHVPGLALGDVAAVAESLGDVRERMGAFAPSSVAYGRARRLLAGDPAAQVRLLMKEGVLREHAGRYSESLRWLGRALRLDDACTPHSPSRAELLVEHGGVRFRLGRYRAAIEWCERGAAHAEAVGDRRALARAYYLLHVIHMSFGSPERVRYRDLALPIYEELGDLLRQGYVLNNLGIDAYYGGSWTEAVSLYQRSRDALLRAGAWVEAGDADYNIAEILADQGHLEAAERVTRDTLSAHRAAGYRMGVAFSLVLRGRIAARAGRHDEAAELLRAGRDEWAGLGDEPHVLDADAKIVEGMLLAGGDPAAREPAEALVRRSERLDVAPAIQCLVYRLGGIARAQAGNRDGAIEFIERAIALAREADDRYELAMALETLAHVAGGRDDAELLLAEALALREQLGVVAVPAFPLP